MKLPTKCTYEKLQRLLELGYTVEVDGCPFPPYYIERLGGDTCIVNFETDQITAIHPPKFKRYEVGDKVWWGKSIKVIQSVFDRFDYLLEGGIYATHFEILPYFEEEEEKVECNHQFWKDRNPPVCMNCGVTERCINQQKLTEYLKNREYLSPGEDEQEQEQEHKEIEIDGKKYTLTPCDNE